MTNHPLTDEDCYKLCNACRKVNLGLAHVFDSMRRAADWQLEQVADWIEENGKEYVYYDEWSGFAMFSSDEMIADLKKAMRPQQQENKSDSPKTQGEWVQTEEMARCLGISIRTIHHYRQRKDSPFLEDRHYRRRTPAKKAPWIWNKELTLKAWAQA